VSLILAAFANIAAGAKATPLSVTAYRPPASSWKRTPCGSPAEKPTPPGPYTENVDYAGNDITGCGSGTAYENGCVLESTASHLDCETKCNATKACVLYVFAPKNCSGQAGPVCWIKSAIGHPAKGSACRNSRVVGTGGKSQQTDIPTKWGANITADTTPLVAYPRPQMVRGTGTRKLLTPDQLRDVGDATTWTNLNGLWEWEPTTPGSPPPFGQTLSGSILVPFPVESCLSGVAPGSSADIVMSMWYRLTFDATQAPHTLLHFGAIDWQSTVYLNGKKLGNHTGGYDGFNFDVTSGLKATGNELLVYVFDPSDTGKQPNGKQRISAISSPGGDTYTPSSGIWQTVWLEAAPATYIESLIINQASATAVTIQTNVAGGGSTTVSYTVKDASGTSVASGSATSGTNVTLKIPNAKLWSPASPYLYDVEISVAAGTDSVLSYFGLRTFKLGDGPKGKRPLLNGEFTFMAGFLDQSYFPDGLYTAPTDDALAYDIQVVPMFGMNMIRLHQKVNPERWYYHADKIGVAIFQDMVQKYGGANDQTVPYFVQDFIAMVKGRGNHPSIVQIETFNEGDCWGVFNKKPFDVAAIVQLARELAPDRLIDTDSGGGANKLGIGDVNDVHSYPFPGNPAASATQYAMIGEFGGIGAFQTGHMWTPSGCFAYKANPDSHDQATMYIGMAGTIKSNRDHISASVYTQTTDLERECDGFLNYDRTNKFSLADTAAIAAANKALINGN